MVAATQFPAKPDKKTSLGSDRKIRVPLPEIPKAPDDETPLEYRFRLQKWARSCYGNFDSRLAGCCIRPVPGAWGVDVVRNPGSNTAHFVNLEQCNRVWTCPVCAQRITSERRKEIVYALAQAKKKGFTAVLVTYTLRHGVDDLFVALLDALQRSMRAFKSGRAFQDIKREYGIVGGIKTLEPTYGENGWHPHIHEIMLLDVDPKKVNVAALKKWLADRWLAMLEKQGYDASFEHGLDVRTADSDVADYVAKWGKQPREMTWGVEHEIASAGSKKAHRDGLTPFQLLEAVSGGDRRARVLFHEYATVMKGKRQLVWSPGLRALLELPDELPDEQLPLCEAEAESYTILEIEPDEWKRCCVYELQPLLLQLCGIGATAALRAILDARDIRARIHEPPAERTAAPQLHLSRTTAITTAVAHKQLSLPGISTGGHYA